MTYNIDHFLAGLEKVASQKELESYFHKQIQSLGYNEYDAYCVDANTLQQPKQAGNFVVASYPLHFLKKYIEKGFVAQCPALAEAGKSNLPFDYVEYIKKQRRSPSTEWELKVADMFNIKYAWLVPLNRINTYAGVTLYFDSKYNDNYEQFISTRDTIHIMSTYFFDALSAFNPANQMSKRFNEDLPAKSTLSDRELECLSWCAKGKTNENIGMILGISENTVRFHMKNIFRKLDVSSRGHAITRANSMNLLNSCS